MGFLYINSKGQKWTKHSYSAGIDWDQCAYKYYLRRVLGWHEKDNKASLLFGRALEGAIQYHHDHNGEGAVDDFKRRWAVYKDTEDVVYSEVEKNWVTCNQIGIDMIRLYVALQPKLPIPLGGHSVFQREYAKEVFLNHEEYGGIEYVGKLDIICYVDPSHIMLPKIEWKKEYGLYRPLIVDIKTSAVDFPEQPGMAAYDTQLRHYSWLSGIRDVSFLWFKKSGLGYKKGYSVTFIEPVRQYAPGDEGVVAAQIDNENFWIVKNDFMVTEMERIQGRKSEGKLDQTSAAKERALNWLQYNGVLVSKDKLTRQRLQFNAGFVTQESAADAGRTIERQIIEIVNAWKTKCYPNTFGIRYPRNDQNDAYFRAFVLGDEAFKKQNLIKKSEEDFDDLFYREF
jgi:hypothetical protein